MAGTRVATGFVALIALRIAQPIRLGVQQSVQRLLHAPSNHAVEVVLNPRIVNRDDMAQWTGVVSVMAAPSCCPGCV